MALTVTMPQLGESVTEGTIARWLKQPGDAIAKYKSIAEVITDKVNAEIPAPADGVMSELIAPEGAVVPVGQPICSIDTGAAASEAASGTSGTGGSRRRSPGGAERGGRARRRAAPVARSAPVAPAAPAEPQAGGETAVAPIQAAFTESPPATPASGEAAGGNGQAGGFHVTPGGAHARSRARGRPLPDHGHRDRGADLQEGRS